jgi:peroxiredoxin
LTTLIFVSCKDLNSYTIRGEIAGLESAEIYVVTTDSSTFRNDTIQSKKGKFRFNAVSETLEPVVIYMENGNVWITIWAQNGEKISLSGDVNYPELITVQGGEVNNLLTTFKNENKEILKERRELKDKISANANQSGELSAEVAGSQLSSKIKNLDQLLKMRAEDFVKKYPNSVASLVLIEDYILDIDDASSIQSVLSLITDPAKENELFEKLQVWSLKDKLTDVGSPAPDFSVIDTKNDTITPETFKGKYLLLTFAATWCPFCEPDYPKWVDIRKKFSEKKLGFLIISLDENGDSWKKLAEEKKIKGTQVIDNAGWASSMVSLYNVSEIPCNYLIDKENKIVGSKIPIDSIRTLLETYIPPPPLKNK